MNIVNEPTSFEVFGFQLIQDFIERLASNEIPSASAVDSWDDICKFE